MPDASPTRTARSSGEPVRTAGHGDRHQEGAQALPLADGRPELVEQEGLLNLMATSSRLQRQCACGAPSAGGGSCAACEATASASKHLLQRKPLEIGAADDPLEREADEVAERVMRMEEPMAIPLDQAQPSQAIRMRSTDGAALVGEAPSSVHATLASPGQPLAPSARAFFEPRFGADLGHVRVHTDGLAQQSAREVHAQAYAAGSHLVFGSGRYAPETSAGKHLLAHELAHVLQQGDVIRRDGEEQAADGEASWSDTLWSVLETIGGGLLGEFNEDPEFAEIGVDLGVSLVPFLDQASDVRDLAAHLYYMGLREGELERPMRWIGLAFTLIGLFPEIGSAIKGASKLVIRGGRNVLGHLDELMRLIRRVMGEASATLDDFVVLIRRSWPAITRFGRELWFTKLAEVRRLLEEVPSLLRSQVQRLIDQIDEIWRRSPQMLNNAMASIGEMLRGGFEALGVRMDSRVLGTSGGPPGFFMSMSSMGDEIAEEMRHLSGGTGTAGRSPHAPEELGSAPRRPEADDPQPADQRLQPEASLRGAAEAARARGLPSEIVDDGYVYAREDFSDVVPETGLPNPRSARPAPPLAYERGRGVAGRRPTTAPDPEDVQNSTLAADLILIENHLAALNSGLPPGSRWTLEDVRINRRQTVEGVAGPARASLHTRPDLQLSIRDPEGNAQRFLIEYDRSLPTRALSHARGILERDPTAIVILKVIGFE